MERNLKRISAMGMCVIMAFSMVGCKNEDKKKEDKGSTEDSKYAWEVSSVSLSGLEYGMMSNAIMIDGVLYYTTYAYDEASGNSSEQICSFELTSSDEPKVIAQYDNKETTGYGISGISKNKDGNLTFVKQTYEFDFSIDENGGIDLGDIPEDATITEEYLQQLGIDLASVDLVFSDISSLTVKEFVTMYESLTTEQTESSSVTTELVSIGEDGKELSSKPLDVAENTNFYNTISDGNGNVYNVSTSWTDDGDISNNTLTILNIDSGEVENITLECEFQCLAVTGSGDVKGIAYGEDGMEILSFEQEKKKFSDEKKNLDVDWIDGNCFPAGKDSFYYSSDGILYEYNIKDEKSSKIMKFMDWDIIADNLDYVYAKDEEDMYVITTAYGVNGETTYLNHMTRIDASEAKKKKEITIGCIYNEQNISGVVAELNKQSTEYRFVIKEYTEEIEDYDEAIKQLNEDILNGEGPDIVDMRTLDPKRYEGLSLFEDLHSYINADAELSKINFNKNILSLFEDDGKLYALPATYGITVLASSKDILGSEKLTLDKFSEIIAANPDKEILSYCSNSEVLNTLFTYNESYFVDYANKTCNFSDGTFEKILNIAKTFPSSEEISEAFDEDNYVSEAKKASDGTVVFFPSFLSDVNDYKVIDLLYQNNAAVTGYPTITGDGFSASATSSVYAISSASEYKEQCWSFVKSAYESASEVNGMFYSGFPIDNDKLEEYLKEACIPEYELDEDGNPTGNEITSGYSWEDLDLELYALTEEQANAIKALTESVTSLNQFEDYAGDVLNIIEEEAQAFFEGNKTAKEVSDVIQSRVNIVINEKN